MSTVSNSSSHFSNVARGIGTGRDSQWSTGFIVDVKVGYTTDFMGREAYYLCDAEVTVS